VEWAGAVRQRPRSRWCRGSTSTTDGIDLATQYIVNHATAPVVSVSYGSCEQEMGSAELAFYNSLWEQAASQGMTVFVSLPATRARRAVRRLFSQGRAGGGERAMQFALLHVRGRHGIQ